MPKSRRLPAGQGTALKPAYEPIVLARVPTTRPITRTIQDWGTGALNTEACAIPDHTSPDGAPRWPANLVLSHEHACSERVCAAGCPVRGLDQGSPATRPSRFFYSAKASRRERDAGCERLPKRTLDLFPSTSGTSRHEARNAHPTVKPIDLMRWLTRLVTPDGGVVLDPFCGSGSTGAAVRLEGRRFVGIERDPAHADVARARVRHWDPTPAHPRRPQRSRRRGDQ